MQPDLAVHPDRDDHRLAVAHHFEDFEQQHEANLLGMWTFLATEVLFFGGLFLAYMVYRMAYAPVFAQASQYLDVVLGTLNTAILLTSSLTMAMAVHTVNERQRQRSAILLLVTMGLGLLFLSIKGLEYYHKFEEHLIPGASFQWPDAQRGPAQLFFSLYLAMTGLHALHMIIGIGIIAVFAWSTWRGHYEHDPTPVEMLGLYWHFVDIVWIFLFPLLYLIQR